MGKSQLVNSMQRHHHRVNVSYDSIIFSSTGFSAAVA